MGLILLDTSVLIDHLRESRSARNTMLNAIDRGDRLVASVLTKVEINAGMRSHERRAVRDLLDSLYWVDVTEAIADDAGTLARKYRRSHPGVGVVDFAIAATAMHLGAELWTRNVRHFPMFDGLAPPYGN